MVGQENRDDLPQPSRRAVLLSTGVAVAGISGCSGSDGGESNNSNSSSDNTTDTDSDSSNRIRSGSIDDDTGATEVVAWNEQLIDIIRAIPETSNQAVRRTAILNISLFDAVTTITAARGQSHFQPYGNYEGVPAGASRPAAVHGAAHEALTQMYATSQPTLDERLNELLDEQTYSGDVTAGEEWGRTVASDIVESRADDGYDDSESYDPCPGRDPAETPGCWRGGSVGTWRDSHYAFLDTWVLDEPVSFDGPPPLDSEQYAKAWQEVYETGDSRRDRPEEQTDIAQFWRGGAGTARTSGRWVQIANEAMQEFDLTILETARLFALLGIAMADFGVSVWRGKHEYGFWRPAEAIAAGDTDGNPQTFADPDWRPIAIGSSPEYPSGLAGFGAAAQTTLAEVLGTDKLSFELRSLGPPAQTRSFDGFGQALEESIQSRLYIGNHFRFSLEDGAAVGEEIAETVLDTQLQPVQ